MKTALIVAMMIAVALDVVLLGYAVTRQDRTRALSFTILSAAIFLYALGYLFELMSVTAESAMTALKLENIGIPLVAPFFMLTCIVLYQPQFYRRWMPPLFIIYGAIISVCTIFNDSHQLYYTIAEMRKDNGEYFMFLGKGPLYVAQQTVSVLLLIVTYVVLLSAYSKDNKNNRQKMNFIIMGSVLPFIANIINFSGVLPMGVDPTPIAMTLGVVLFSIDLIRYRPLDLISYATSNAVYTMSDAFVALDLEGGFMFANRSAKALFPALRDLRENELIEQIEGWPSELDSGARAGKVTFVRVAPGSDTASTYSANVSSIVGLRNQTVGWSIVIQDITDTMGLMQRLEELATLDPLTGIFNRRSFTELVCRELAKGERHDMNQVLIMYDLDYFKSVNDLYGHQAGDYVLCAVVEIVRSQLRSYVIFARYGGEEFVVFTSIADLRRPFELPERLRNAIASAVIRYEGIHIPITASFGVVTIQAGTDFNDALRAVDGAMYKAKAEGRNRVAYGQIVSRQKKR